MQTTRVPAGDDQALADLVRRLTRQGRSVITTSDDGAEIVVVHEERRAYEERPA